jgi:hypothetical protein
LANLDQIGYLAWIGGLLDFVFSIVKSTANPTLTTFLTKHTRALLLVLLVFFLVESALHLFDWFNAALFGCLSIFLVLFYSALLKMNQSHLVASTATCDSLLLAMIVSFVALFNRLVHFLSGNLALCLSGDLIEGSVVALTVYLIARLSRVGSISAYIHPEKAIEIGSIEDDGVQDAVIDFLFPLDESPAKDDDVI